MLSGMRSVILTTVCAAIIALVIWDLNTELVGFDADSVAVDFPAGAEGDHQSASASCDDQGNCVEHILDLELYTDPDYSFSVAIPAGWSRIVAADAIVGETDDVLASLEPGYAVGFESPRSGLDDRFADYILIEVLPGDDTGLFEASEEQRRVFRSGADRIIYDRLEIDGATDDASDVDLVIFQHGIKALGYTLGFYAIGEPSNEQAMFDAFQILLRTYTQKHDPFVII